MPDTTQLTDLQLALLRVLWTRGEATVQDMVEALRPERDLAPTTVATLLSRLEKRRLPRRGARLDGERSHRHLVWRRRGRPHEPPPGRPGGEPR